LPRERYRDISAPVLKDNSEIRDLFSSSGLDTVVVVAYGKMIPSDMLTVPARGFINIHASLLPELRGASPSTGPSWPDTRAPASVS
jgi:methionyl-tRNA formyltransferase